MMISYNIAMVECRCRPVTVMTYLAQPTTRAALRLDHLISTKVNSHWGPPWGPKS